VLVALDKRFGATIAPDETALSSRPPKAKTDDVADASAPPNSGWASLLLNLTGAGAAPRLATAVEATAGSVIVEGGAGRRGLGAVNDTAMPSDAPTATSMVALNAGSPPVAVTVMRSITYLGLDPTVRASGLERIPAAASSGSGSTAAAPAASTHASHRDIALPGAANANADPSAMSDGRPSGQSPPGSGGGEHASDKSAGAAGAQPTSGAPTARAVSAADAAPTASDAISANGVPVVQISRIADFVAEAASGMDPQGGDASKLARLGDSPAAANTVPVKELEVQLSPKSLGALSIQMRLSSGTLKVTIKAENAATLKLVGNETGAISDKLKSLNFSVESITVKALDTVATTGAAGEAAQSGTPGHGEAYQGQSGQAAGGSAREERSFAGEADQRDPPRPNRGGMGEAGGDGDPGHRFV
jgi:flagellar hook-length control protein FliK